MEPCDNCHQKISSSRIEYIYPNIKLCAVCYDKYTNYELSIDDEGNLVRMSKYYEFIEDEPYWYDEDRPY